MEEIALQKQALPPRVDKKEEHYNKRNKIISAIISIFLVLTIVGATAYIVIFSLYAPVYIQGQSMYPTLNNFERVTGIEYREFGLMNPNPRKVRRGDIVIFDVSSDMSGDYIVKRVIGLPGETLKIYDGGNNPDYIEISNSDVTFTLEETYLTTNASYLSYLGSYATHSAITLGEDEYFALGDNRGASQDSRMIGPLSASRLKGKLVVIFGYYKDVTKYNDGSAYKDTTRHYYAPWNWRFY